MRCFFVRAIFTSALIHELDCSLLIRRFSRGEEIILPLMGDDATIEEMSEKPGQEITIFGYSAFINLVIVLILCPNFALRPLRG